MTRRLTSSRRSCVARDADAHGMVHGAVVGVVVLLAGAILCLIFLPGQQADRPA